MSEELDDPLVGTTIGGSYQILRAVGEGGMGTVYEARHARIATRRYAVKTLHPEHLRDASAVARFKREAEAAASIDSPHVVGVFDVGSAEDGTPYIVGEFLDGEDLGDCLTRVGRLPTPEIVRIVRQICKGLAAAHARGVVHRDIKPENVFLTGDPARPTARVLDFGISRLDSGGTQLTKTGMIMGTPAYMAPEQARGQKVDERADIYSTGAVLYRGLTGSVPFDRPDPPSMIAAVLVEEPPPARSLEPGIDEGLELILQRAMTKDPAARYQTIADLDDALAPYDTAIDVPAITMVVAKGSAPRARPVSASMASLTGPARDVQFARPLLAIYVVLAACCGLVATWTLAGAMAALVRGGEPSATLTPNESGLTILILCLIAATPGYLLVRHLKTLWKSTMNILQLLGTLRACMLAALLTYGGGWVVIRTVETLLQHGEGAAWPGWDVLLVVLALGASITSMRRLGSERSSTTVLPRPLSLAVAVVLLLLSTALVGVLRGDTAEIAQADEDDEQLESGKTSGRKSKAKSKRAPPALLTSAQAGGVAKLLELSERFPKDPSVLSALALAQASGKQGRVAALGTIARLLEVDAKAADDLSIQQIVRDAASGPPAEMALALSLLGEKMGARGPDILYELSLSSRSKAQAAAKLAEPAVAKRASPALSIAIELRNAKGCEAVAKLVERAGREGDQRCVVILQPYVVARSYKCGFLGMKTCRSKPKCPAKTLVIQQALQAIRARNPG